jgi:hypothetical protein
MHIIPTVSTPSQQYPEVVAHGTLARAIAAAAARRGAGVGDVSTPAGHDHLDAWRFAALECGEQRMSVYLSLAQRRFGVGVSRGSRVRGEGTADSLDTVVDLAAAWCAGMPLRQAPQRFPFLVAGDLELAFEAGTHVEYRWDRFLGEAGDYPNMSPLLRAAHADDRLRLLFPSVSHDEQLRFDLDAFDEAAGQIVIELLPPGQYRVSARPGEAGGPYDVDGAVHRAAEFASAR